MNVARVGDLAEQVRGVTFAKSDASSTPSEGCVPILTAGNIQDGRLVLNDLTYVPTTTVRDKQRVRKDDVVLCTSSGSLSVVGKAARSHGGFEGGFGAFLKVLRPGPDVDPGYFAHFFQTPAYRRRVASLAAGANINNLKNEHLDELEIPLPPLNEQRRIAAILDHADGLRAKRRQILAHLDIVTQVCFEEMFTNGEYARLPMGGLIADQQIGLDRRASEQGIDRGHDYVKMDAITRQGKLNLGTLTRVDASADEVARYSLSDGDLLLNTRNSRELVGKTAVYRGKPRLYNNNLMRIRFDGRVLPDFVHRYLWSREGRHQLEARKSGTTNVFAVYGKSLATLEVPVPPLDLQRKFASLVERAEAQRVVVQRALAAEDELSSSLQSRAFRGEL